MTKPQLHTLSACKGCGATGDDFASANVEAFEVTGELYCDDCAEDALACPMCADGFWPKDAVTCPKCDAELPDD